MRRYLFSRDGRTERVDRYTHRGWRRVWPRSRAMGCLMWLVLLVLLLILLSVLFGGFQKGTKVNGMHPAASVTDAAAVVAVAASPAATLYNLRKYFRSQGRMRAPLTWCYLTGQR
jgi:hypothetical protein